MTLEEMQDAKAYPLRYTIKHPGMTPKEMAKKEMKRQGMRPGAVPKNLRDGNGLAEGDASIMDRVSSVVRDNPFIVSSEVAKAMGVQRHSAQCYLRTAVINGLIEQHGEVNDERKYTIREPKA